MSPGRIAESTRHKLPERERSARSHRSVRTRSPASRTGSWRPQQRNRPFRPAGTQSVGGSTADRAAEGAIRAHHPRIHRLSRGSEHAARAAALNRQHRGNELSEGQGDQQSHREIVRLDQYLLQRSQPEPQNRECVLVPTGREVERDPDDRCQPRARAGLTASGTGSRANQPLVRW